MNLNALASSVTRVITPAIIGAVRISTGPVKNADYSTTPGLSDPVAAAFDVQALDGGDIRHVDALNLQGIKRAFYFNGFIEGLDRPAGKGGDVLTFAADPSVPTWLVNTTWLVTDVDEPWDAAGWVKVIGTKQNVTPA